MTQPIKQSRRVLLEEFLAAHPQDAFARYGLAMECANQGDAAAAIENFEKLLAENPNYVGRYFQYGQLLARLSRTAHAKSTLSEAIQAAPVNADTHRGPDMETAPAQ